MSESIEPTTPPPAKSAKAPQAPQIPQTHQQRLDALEDKRKAQALALRREIAVVKREMLDQARRDETRAKIILGGLVVGSTASLRGKLFKALMPGLLDGDREHLKMVYPELFEPAPAATPTVEVPVQAVTPADPPAPVVAPVAIVAPLPVEAPVPVVVPVPVEVLAPVQQAVHAVSVPGV